MGRGTVEGVVAAEAVVVVTPETVGADGTLVIVGAVVIVDLAGNVHPFIPTPFPKVRLHACLYICLSICP